MTSTRQLLIAPAVLAAFLGMAVSPGFASTATEQREGELLFQQLQAGTKRCSTLTPDQFERIGEFAMGRMVGSTTRHSEMNAQMRRMMGASGEEQAHQSMGRQFADCGGAGSMMSMGSGMSGTGSGMSGTGSGMSGTGSGMMGGGAEGHAAAANGWRIADTVIVVLLGLILLAVVTCLAVWRPRRQSTA
jgi:cobalamin biosynthesis Mg chelatase CobN